MHKRIENEEATGVHLPVLCRETIVALIPEPGKLGDGAVFIDATFGRGGHARALLAELPATARVIAIDRDPAAVEFGRQMAQEDNRLLVVHARFSELDTVLNGLGVEKVSGVVMDLGVSSPQLDEAERGFSFRSDGPVDMRMDQSGGRTAAQWINESTESEIAQILKTLGEERYSGRIARAIVRERPFESTRVLAGVIAGAQPPRARSRRGATKHDATRSFQAIRMHINDELGEISAGIAIAFDRLSIGGRLAVISFHSLEDRLVKQTFRKISAGPELPRRLPVRSVETLGVARVVGKMVRASSAEIAGNPRSRSASLRVLERTA